MHSRKMSFYAALWLGSFIADALPGRTIGPDVAGYRGSDEVPFSFEDISTTGTLVLAGTDDGVITTSLGFTFEFYGVSYTSVSWSTNGLMSFVGTNSQFSNSNISTTRTIGDRPSIAVYWDDWRFLAGISQGSYHETRGAPGSRRFIVQWSGAVSFDPAGQPVTYQAILFEGSNNILMQYLDADSGDAGSFGALATVGIRDTNGQVNGRNLLWSFNQAVLSNGLAIRFSTATDTVSPVVSIVSPADGSFVSESSVQVQAAVVDSGSTSVSSVPEGVSGALPAGGGTVTGSVALVEGANTITVTALDSAGNSGGTSITVVRDSIAPVITGVSPPDGSVAGTTFLLLTVEVFDASEVTLTVSGNSRQIPPGGGLQAFGVILNEGENTITVLAQDVAGNTASLVTHLVLDLSAPVLAIDSPLEGSVFGPGASPVPVIVTVNDASATTVTSAPAGAEGSLPAGGGVVSGAIHLAEGSNSIDVTATDAMGRMASASVTVVFDTTPPTISLDSPAAGIVRGTIDFDASAADAAPGSGIARVELSVDGSVMGTLTSPPFQSALDTAGLPDGLHVLTATAFDGIGNSASDSVNVLVDNAAPVLTFSSPEEGAQVSGLVSFRLEASDAGGGMAFLEVLANGTEPTAAPAVTYESPVPSDVLNGQEDSTRWPDGELRFSARGLDAAGNEAVAVLVVRVVNSAPPVISLSPGEGSVVSGRISIEAAVSCHELALVEIFVDGVPLGSSSSSPLSAPFDTTSRLDGAMAVSAVAVDASGSVASASVNLIVDNMVVKMTPTVLNLKSKGGDVKVTVKGSSSRLLLAAGRRIELRVPGAGTVPAGRVRRHRDCVKISFDRKALLASLRAGIAGGAIAPESMVELVLVADGLEVGAAGLLLRERCGR